MVEFGRIDILVNNAAATKTSHTNEKNSGMCYQIDLSGAFNCIQAVVDVMINQGSGYN